MIPELGHFALILALLLSLTLAAFSLTGAQKGIALWITLSRPTALSLFFTIAVAFGCLAWAFLHNDFSVRYVAEHSNSQLPVQYQFSAVWGGHEGSLLLWVLMLTGWTAAVALFSRRLPDPIVARVLGVLGLVTAGFLLFILLTSNPFDRLLPIPTEGRDLNPMLQDPGLVYHPPHAVHGLCGVLCGFCLCLSSPHLGQAGRCLGALVAPMDLGCMGILNAGHLLWFTLGLLRIGLGRLVVLGSGRKRFLYAMAGGYGSHSFIGGHGKAWRL